MSDQDRIVASQVYIGGIVKSEVAVTGDEDVEMPLNFFSSGMFKGSMFKPKLFVGEPE